MRFIPTFYILVPDFDFQDKVVVIESNSHYMLMRFQPLLQSRQIDFNGIIVNSICTFFVFTIWRVLFNNYSKEVFDITASQIGIIQAVREVPGLLGFGVGLLALLFSEVRIATISLAINGIGLIVIGVADSIWMLGAGTFIMSVGFHYFISANGSLLLHYIKGPESGRKQGTIASWEAAAGVAGTLSVLLLSLITGYRSILVISGALIAVIGLVLTLFYKNDRIGGEKRAFRMKKKYWLYYSLFFLRGCRRHIFTTFAIFLLVANHALKIEYTALLMLATLTVTIWSNKQIGNLTEKIGERIILVSSSMILVFVFTGYAYFTSIYFLIGLFVIDQIMFGSSLALQSYIRKIAPPEDLTSCVSFGLTSNHISAVIIPVVGGILWDTFGYRNTFIMGAAFVFADMCLAFLVNPKKANQ